MHNGRYPNFDLEYDKFRCLHGYSEFTQSAGRDVQRVTESFDKPQFFPSKGAAHSNSIQQGQLGDCHFLSALATVSGFPGLIEKICVAVRRFLESITREDHLNYPFCSETKRLVFMDSSFTKTRNGLVSSLMSTVHFHAFTFQEAEVQIYALHQYPQV